MQELPDSPTWLLKQAVRSFYKEHYRLASWFCWIELLRSPRGYFTLCYYANSLYFLGNNNDSKAASLYKRAIAINPSLPLAHAGLGRIHYSNAVKIHQEYSLFPGGSFVMFADEKSPEDIENKNSISIMGYADSQVGNRRIAIKELEKAADLSSDNQDKVDLLYMASQIYCIIDNKQAIKAYKKVILLNPEHVQAHYDLAGCFAATGDIKNSLKEYKYIKDNAPEEASNLEAVLASFDINLD